MVTMCWVNISTLTVGLLIDILPLVYNTFIFGATAFKTLQHALEMRRMGRKSMSEILLLDGESKSVLHFCYYSLS